MIFRTDYTPEKVLELIKSPEPIFIFRAKDACLVDMLRQYALANRRKGNETQAEEISEIIPKIIEWQEQNIETVKLADCPKQLNLFQ